jgi:hypothetical protein
VVDDDVLAVGRRRVGVRVDLPGARGIHSCAALADRNLRPEIWVISLAPVTGSLHWRCGW